MDPDEILKTALAYSQDFGWAVFPCHSIRDQKRCSCGNADCDSPGKHPRTQHGLRDATKDEVTIRSWFARWRDANLAVATGASSGFDVLDVDPRHGGEDSLGELVQSQAALPPSVESLTGGGGRHIFFSHHVGVRNKAGQHSGLPPGLDVRGDGGYIVVPPSGHVSGGRYRWELSSQPSDVPLADWPQWLLGLLVADNGKPTPAAAIEGPVCEGSRNATLTSMAGTMRWRGMGEESILAALLRENERCQPPLDESEVKSIAASVGRYEPGQSAVLMDTRDDESVSSRQLLPTTEFGNARRLIARHGKNIRYCGVLGGWFVYDGKRWRRDESLKIMELAKDTVVHMGREARAIEDPETRKVYTKHAARCQSHRAIKAMTDLARSDRAVCVESNVFDQHDLLLNVLNGTLNLNTGDLRPHRRDDMLTQLANVAYDPEADCPRWRDFVASICDGDGDLIDFLCRAAGYALTGSTTEQAFFILHGNGCNGKSTYLEILKGLMGDYAQTAETSTFLEKHGDTIPNDLAALRSARLVLASETGHRRSLSEPLIKRVTGSEAIAARFLHREFFTYVPRFKVMLATNDKPRVFGTDRGIWRRIRLIPFTVNFEGREDRNLSERLKGGLPGILNWALAGCTAWREGALGSAAQIDTATQAYRDEMDVLGDFIDECCMVGVGEVVKKRDLYETYVAWADKAKEKPTSKIAFGRIIIHRVDGVKADRISGGAHCWRGVGLKFGRDETSLEAAVEPGNVPFDV